MDLLNVQQAADELNVTKRWVRRAIFEKTLPYVKVGRLVRIERSSLQKFIEENRQPAA